MCFIVRLELRKASVHNVRTLLVCPMGINTGMFEGIFAGDHWSMPLCRWLTPLLDPAQVATCVLDGIQRRKKLIVTCASGWRGVALPWLPYVAKLLPVDAYDAVMAIGGGYFGMDGFVGRAKPDPKTD